MPTARRPAKRLLGNLVLLLGLALMLGAFGWAFKNQQEDRRAGEFSIQAVQQLMKENPPIRPAARQDMPPAQAEVIPPMPRSTQDGRDYIGILEVPDLGICLPILADWDYDSLMLAPCRYSGNYYGGDLILAGHSYASQFRPLRKAAVGMDVYFTNPLGLVFHYRVEEFEIIEETEIEALITGSWDMTLFTCTSSGTTRCVVRCVLTDL